MNNPKKPKKFLEIQKIFKNNIVKIRNKSNGVLTADPNGYYAICTDDSNSTNQQWIIYPLDGGQYIIVNMGVGKVLTQPYETGDSDIPLYVKSLGDYTNNIQDKWTFHTIEQDKNYYYIRNMNNGLRIQQNDIKNNYIINNDDEEFKNSVAWTFEKVEELNIPEQPKLEDLDRFPQLTKDNYQTSLKDTDPKLTGWTLLPAPMVIDNNLNLKQQLEDSPYYILEKYQNWSKLFQMPIHPNENLEKKINHEVDKTEENSMEKSTGISVSVDGGFNFGANAISGTANLRQTIKNNLHVTESQTLQTRNDITTTIEYNNNLTETIYIAKYILQTELKIIGINDDRIINKYVYDEPNFAQTTAYIEPSEDQNNNNLVKNRVIKSGVTSHMVAPYIIRTDEDDPEKYSPVCTEPF
ncbi:hypothetical protein PDJ95_29290 [Bacillus cereus]|nr:hypothetical protein [Bacillus cereus]